MLRLSFIYPISLLLLLLLVPLWAGALLLPHRLPPVRFWSSLLLRSGMILALVFSLAGTQIVQQVDDLTTVFLIDSSDSVSASARGQAEAFVQEALRAMSSNDKSAIVVFGENALVDRAPSTLSTLGRLTSAPVAARTNIEQAVQLGLALFPADTKKRLVLLSDGGENAGRAIDAAKLAATRGVRLDIVNMANPSDSEALLAELQAPSQVRDGQQFTLTATVESTVEQGALLRIFNDQQVVIEQNVNLKAGVTTFTFPVAATGQGFQRYRAQITPQSDGRVQNNEAATLVQVEGPPRVLLVADVAGEAQNLRDALVAASVSAEITTPGAMPTDLAGLSSYETVVLVNVPARDLPVKAMAALPTYVRDLGKGLMMIGGRESFGVGGYGRTPLEEALPVYMDVRNREERPNLALVFIIDKSGSMDACHCSGPNRQTAQFRQGGIPKVDIAKDAVVQASALLGQQDTLGVVAFDDSAHWVLPAQRGAGVDTVENSVSSVQPQGSTNVRAGLLAAEETLNNTDARIKHAILLTDGWSGGGDNLEIAQRMRDAGITLSVVAAGSGSADYLERLAQEGGGRYYPAQDMSEVPQIFVQETITAVGNYIIEKPFTPIRVGDSPILSGLDGLPPLYGYNGSTLKEAARTVLVADDDSPVLAQWQYGLGRSIAWTSDTKGQWARDWVGWDEFPRFASQLVGWVLPRSDGQGLNAELRVEGTQAVIDVQASDAQGTPQEGLDMQATIVNGTGEPQRVPLRQVAPGEYRASIPSPVPGTYLVQISGQQDGRAVLQEVAGLVVPYSPEYRQGQSNPELLSELARTTGGAALTNPSAAFDHNLDSVRRAQEIAWPLLLLALLLLPFDIAVRRLLLRRSDFSTASGWLQTTILRRTPAEPVSDERLARLGEAKRRATSQNAPPRPSAPSSPPPAATTAPSQPATPQPTATPPAPEDSLARLREARDKARRRARGEDV